MPVAEINVNCKDEEEFNDVVAVVKELNSVITIRGTRVIDGSDIITLRKAVVAGDGDFVWQFIQNLIKE